MRKITGGGMGMNAKMCVAVGALALAGLATAQDDERRGEGERPRRDNRGSLGVELGVFIPQDSEIRDLFGNSMFRIGVGYVANRQSLGRRFTPEIGLISASNDGNRFLLVPVTLGYEWHFTNRGERQSTIPYFRVAAGLAYYNYDITTGGTNESASRFGPTGTLEGGLLIGDNVRLSARYYLFSEQDGFNFSGFQFSVTFGFIRL